MSNGDQQANCILEVCCAPHSDEQYHALAEKIRKDLHDVALTPERVAKYILSHYDLAEVGTLSAFKASIARVALAGSSGQKT